MSNLPADRYVGVQRTHAQGLALLLVAIALGVGVVLWLDRGGPEQMALGLLLESRRDTIEAPRSRTGLIPTTENVGQVAFGRSCDSCHPAGRGANVASLRSAQFKRKYANEAAIAELVRRGRVGMPAYPVSLISDADLLAIGLFIRGLPEE